MSQFRQPLRLTLDLVVLIGRDSWGVLRDVVEPTEPVAEGLWEPVDFQAGLLSPLIVVDAPRARQAARRLAPSAMAASLDTHGVEGSSASLSA